MADRYNPPPNWPRPPADWTPPPGWKPDPSWGPPPYGWQLWIDDSPPRATFGRRPLGVALGFVVGVTILLAYVFVFSAPGETSVVTLDPDDQPARRTPKADRDADRGPVPTARQAPAPYSAEPHPPATSPKEPHRDSSAGLSTPSEPSDSGNDSRHDRSRNWPHHVDPWFVNCRRARESGYGPYYFGRDIEYFWYHDRDRDGLACE
ncbi:excalibur calcium-binding domain-containing protein [Actinopolymorpha sp. B9G3]|uniref:excalibur calcium-binding domain-containing protein n=1 Tax=Actinopolymorpha sp. B9G3 TaxID=3158970 RepID=UPI0032D99928